MFSRPQALVFLASLIFVYALYALNTLSENGLSGASLSVVGAQSLAHSFSRLWHGALCIGIAFVITELIDKLRR